MRKWQLEDTLVVTQSTVMFFDVGGIRISKMIRMSKWNQLRLLFRAHVLRDWEALHDIAAHYASSCEEGLLRRRYYEKAFRYYEYGANKGNPGCQYDYGFML